MGYYKELHAENVRIHDRASREKRLAEQLADKQERGEPIIIEMPSGPLEVHNRRKPYRVVDRSKATVTKPLVGNIPIVDIHRDMFITDWGSKVKPSAAEQLIINELVKYPIIWHREISFRPFTTPDNGHYRYDFFIPSMRLCIEYDGQQAHSSEKNKEMDRIKTEFCKVNNIRLVRYNKYDYYKMEDRIKKLLSQRIQGSNLY